MPRKFLSQMQPGDVVENVYVIANKQIAATTTNKNYIKAIISDRSAQLNARLWNATHELFKMLPESGFVYILGRIESYQQNTQLIITDFGPAKEGTFDIGELIPHTTQSIPKMQKELAGILGSIAHEPLKRLIDQFLKDQPLMAAFSKAPAASSFHHAFLGGLLEHTLTALKLTDAVAGFYPKLSRDLCLAGVFLHDIAKTWELTYDTTFGYSDGGQLVGHVVKAAMWVEAKAQELEAAGKPLPRELIDVLQHILLSHHGQPEFGAARIPASPEAIFVHMIENLDAKLNMALSATRSEAAAGEGNWTDFIKALGVRLYRPDPTSLQQETTQTTPVEPTSKQDESATGSLAAGAPAAKPTLNNPLFETGGTKKK